MRNSTLNLCGADWAFVFAARVLQCGQKLPCLALRSGLLSYYLLILLQTGMLIVFFLASLISKALSTDDTAPPALPKSVCKNKLELQPEVLLPKSPLWKVHAALRMPHTVQFLVRSVHYGFRYFSLDKPSTRLYARDELEKAKSLPASAPFGMHTHVLAPSPKHDGWYL